MSVTPASRSRVKRLFDLAVAVPASVLLLPLAALVVVLVRAALGPPVLFRQVRPGLHGEPFELLKFRTMADVCDRDGRLLPDAERLGLVGRLLRRSSVDELPELINVIRGEMSLVGPRPLLMSYLSRYLPWQARRHEVLPGITGLAQVSGRNLLSWDERFALDVWYVDHWSLALDLKILLKTIAAVVATSGINQPGRETVDEFMGSSQTDPGLKGRS
jgi:lipopolysaccharide/colanic/teichoic acid biosynthesis glycosyltransferase